MQDHGARAHATWSASATARNWGCAGALALAQRKTTPDKENLAAAWGTACHQLSEKCLRANTDAIAYVGTTEKTKEHEFEVDEELAVTAQVYIDYVRAQIAANPGATLKIEQHFSLASLNPPFDAGGTGDAVLYYPATKTIEVVDLKGGRGVIVEVDGNKQLRTYALGAMLANTGLDVQRVKSTVVQPRANHKDGVIRSEEYHVADLMEWTADLVDAMRRSAQAMADFDKGPRAAWNAMHLNAGDHCKFCPVAGSCPALEQRALDAAGVWFDDLDKPQISNSKQPDSMSPEQLSKTLDMLDMIDEWCNAVRAHAHQLAESGVAIPEYQLTEKIGHRKWKNKDEEDKVLEALFVQADLTVEEATTRKLKSPAQVEKVLGAKRKHLIAGLVERPVTGTNLVRSTKTTRAAVPPSVNKHFSVIED